MARVGDNLQVVGAVVDHTTGVMMELRPSTPIRIVRFGVLVVLDAWDAGSNVISLEARTHNAAGTLAAGVTVGGVTLVPVDGNEGTVFYAEPVDEVIVKPGDFIEVEITTAGTAGDLRAFIQYQLLNWDPTSDRADFSDATPTNRMVDSVVVT